MDGRGGLEISRAGTSLSVALSGAFQGRIRAATNTSLRLEPYGGIGYVEIRGDVYALSALTNGDLRLTPTDLLIDAAGGSTGAGMAASTFYYIYVSSRSAATFPGTLRGSTVAPTKVDGVYYLGSTGEALFWRFVGAIETTSGTQFSDNGGGGAQKAATRLVCNYYNRWRRNASCRPAYNDDGADTFVTWPIGAAWEALNGGTDNTIRYIHMGEDCVTATMVFSTQHTPHDVFAVGIGDNSNTTPLRAVVIGGFNDYQAVGPAGLISVDHQPATCTVVLEPVGMGVRTLNMVGFNNGQQVTWWADIRKHGGAIDGPATYMDATLML